MICRICSNDVATYDPKLPPIKGRTQPDPVSERVPYEHGLCHMHWGEIKRLGEQRHTSQAEYMAYVNEFVHKTKAGL